ncbi:MAG: 50S ribosomal protein L13 [Planctomycetes bacterium]|nr:50S ribosomal protein L13 [Planctomycetota bacterium]
MKTFVAKESDIDRKWILVDADGKVLGRLAVAIARVLMGKHKPIYTPHIDCGDFVVVVNAEKVRLTGKKMETKEYQRYSGYPGGLHRTPIAKVLEKHPERIIREAVRRMLPKNKIGRQMFTKLKAYAGEEHPHEAQNPEPVELELK